MFYLFSAPAGLGDSWCQCLWWWVWHLLLLSDSSVPQALLVQGQLMTMLALVFPGWNQLKYLAWNWWVLLKKISHYLITKLINRNVTHIEWKQTDIDGSDTCTCRSKLLPSKWCNTKLVGWWARSPVVWSIGPSWLKWRWSCSICSSNWWLQDIKEKIFLDTLHTKIL